MLERLRKIFKEADFIGIADVYVFRESDNGFSKYIKSDVLLQLDNNVINEDYFKQRVLEESTLIK